MKIYLILLILPTFVWTTQAQTAYNQQPRDPKQNQESLTDIRWVSLNKVNSQNPQADNFQVQNLQRQTSVPSGNHHSTQLQPVQQTNQSDRDFIQKMANQLFLTQKHVPLLSEHQKFIINQDPLVRKYVFGNQEQVQQQGSGNSQYRERSLQLEQNGKTNNVGAAGKTSVDSTKYKQGSDPIGQSSALQYLTLAPPPSYVKYNVVPSLTPKLTLFRSVQPYAYYKLEDGGDLHSHSLQPLSLSASPVSSHLKFTDYKTYPIHATKTIKLTEDHHEHVGDNYQFVYDVKDHAKGNDFGHKEVKEDDKTYGHYYLKLPDGRFETVKYWADKTGFHANVEFKGRAVHPETHHSHHSGHNYDVQLL